MDAVVDVPVVIGDGSRKGIRMNDTIMVHDLRRGPHAISRDLWGVFFEDISYAADGGLASEMVQNGAFEYCREDSPSWSTFTAWSKICPSDGAAAFGVRTRDCVAEENPHYVAVEVPDGVPEGSVALENTGFDGMVLNSGEIYHFRSGPVP
uniref:CAZy families GH51 protein n=1 Tax=uncultured Bifidobacterium sp. TaxID=165187 RepID=A0A060BYT2_9BIFI|nr:CAZy families GH51 protein [uncultured Bifidobacterium sp.]